MSDFWKFKVEKVTKNIAQISVWAMYDDCNRFQNTHDWMFCSFVYAGDEIRSQSDEISNQIKLDDNPNCILENLTGVNSEDSNPKETRKIISKIEINNFKNITPSTAFYQQIYHSDNSNDILPYALYNVEFTEKKYAQILTKGLEWESPCFDLEESFWLLEKKNEILKMKWKPNDNYKHPEFELVSQIFALTEEESYENWRLEAEVNSYENVLLKIEQMKLKGWNLVYCNHFDNSLKFRFREINKPKK